jgi:hypothetical protein
MSKENYQESMKKEMMMIFKEKIRKRKLSHVFVILSGENLFSEEMKMKI